MGNEESAPETDVIDHPLGLTSRQIKHIRKLWTKARADDIYEPGYRILLRVFEKSPEIRRVFSFKEALRPATSSQSNSSTPTTRIQTLNRFLNLDKKNSSHSLASLDAPPNEPNHHKYSIGNRNHESMLKVHARKFSAAFDQLIADLETLENVGPVLKALGSHHADIRTIGFQPRYWDVFAECIVEETVTWGSRKLNVDTEESRAVWTKITQYLINRLKSGYDVALMQNRTLNMSLN